MTQPPQDVGYLLYLSKREATGNFLKQTVL